MLEEAIMGLIDLHCDTLSKIVNTEQSLKKNELQVDLEKLKRAGTSAQFFACFVNAGNFKKEEKISWEEAYQAVLDMIGRMEQETEKEESLQVVRSAEELEERCKNRKISAFLTVEEGGVLNGSQKRLEELREKGISLITLTWNYENCIGFPNSPDPEQMERGLKHFGIETVEHMNALGMLVDVSHLSDGGFWDCIRCSSQPIVASHSNARALCGHPRNLTDDMLRALAEKGGVAGLNFYPLFLRDGGEEVTVDDIARHAAHMIRVAGEELPALGSDFDGFKMKENKDYLQNAGDMEKLWYGLKKQKITERQIDKIWSENAARIIRNVL